MKHYIACMCAMLILLTATGCGDNDTSTPVDAPTEPVTSEAATSPVDLVQVTPELFTMRNLLERVYDAAGYTYAYEDPAEGEDVLDQYVRTLDLTWTDVLKLLKGDNPQEDANIVALCNAVGLSMSDIDWTTLDTIYDLPNTTKTAAKSEYLTTDAEVFVKHMQDGNFETYREAIINIGGSIPDVGTIDASIFSECLNKDMTINRIADLHTVKTMTSPDQLMFKVGESDAPFYLYTERNGHSYIGYYPTICNPNNVGKYLRDTDGDTGVPLWQEYFIAYASWCMNTYGVNLADGIYNNVNDGVEVWWPTNDGCSLELDVYESGLIRILRSSDDRYSTYKVTNVVKDTRIPDALYEWCESEYGLTRADVIALYGLAQIFQLDCVGSENTDDWKEPTEIYVQGLHVIGNNDAYKDYTCGTILNCLRKLALLKVETLDFSYDSSNDDVPLSEVTNEQLIVNHLNVVNLLTSLGAQNSTISIAHFNAATSKVTYVPPDDVRMAPCKEKFNKLIQDDLVKWTFETWVAPVMGYTSVQNALDDKWSEIDYDEFEPLIDKVEQLAINSNDVFSQYFDKVKELSTFNRSDIIFTAVYNITPLPDTVINANIYETEPLTDAYPVIEELAIAIGYTGDSAAKLSKIFETSKEELYEDNGSSSSGVSHW